MKHPPTPGIAIEHYIMKVKHDNGQIRIRVTSLSGKEAAIRQIMAVEGCPRSAIKSIKKLRS
jgi:hypothetical protein